MTNKIIPCLLYDQLNDQQNFKNKIQKKYIVDIISDLFDVDKSTFYRWYSEFNDLTIENKKSDICFDFDSKLITKEIVIFVVSFFLKKIITKNSVKQLKLKINELFPNNNISSSQLYAIIEKNSHCFVSSNYNKRKSKKIDSNVESFIMESINKNKCLVANDIKNLIQTKFKIDISLTSIYNIFKKNNYVYKKTKININPYSFDDQKTQLLNVYMHLNDNNSKICDKTDDYLSDLNKNITKMNEVLNEQTSIIEKFNSNSILTNEIIKSMTNLYENETKIQEVISNDLSHELISIDEMSIITNRASSYGWAKANEECIINIPYSIPNVRYSLLMATSKTKILKYYLIKGSIKTDDYIKFMQELNSKYKNCSYLIDNASIHKNKKTRDMYKKDNMHIIYNAPYQSKFNPIEMVFSLLRKKLNKKIVKNKTEIEEVTNNFITSINPNILLNIFNKSEELLKKYLKT